MYILFITEYIKKNYAYYISLILAILAEFSMNSGLTKTAG